VVFAAVQQSVVMAKKDREEEEDLCVRSYLYKARTAARGVGGIIHRQQGHNSDDVKMMMVWHRCSDNETKMMATYYQ